MVFILVLFFLVKEGGEVGWPQRWSKRVLKQKEGRGRLKSAKLAVRVPSFMDEKKGR